MKNLLLLKRRKFQRNQQMTNPIMKNRLKQNLSQMMEKRDAFGQVIYIYEVIVLLTTLDFSE
jgi:hypothetical protein